MSTAGDLCEETLKDRPCLRPPLSSQIPALSALRKGTVYINIRDITIIIRVPAARESEAFPQHPIQPKRMARSRPDKDCPVLWPQYLGHGALPGREEPDSSLGPHAAGFTDEEGAAAAP